MTTLEFHVPDMACGACATSITQAIQALDASSVVNTDLQSKRVIVTTEKPSPVIEAVVTAAGYTIQPA
jgi:copper chaperone